MLPSKLAAISVLSLLPSLASAQSAPLTDDPYPDGELTGQEIAEEEGALYARLRFLDEPAGLRRGDLVRSDLELNDPLIPGDRLSTTEGRAEIQLADGSLVRLDLGTELALLSLHDSLNNLGYATVLQLTAGSVIIRSNPIDSNFERFQIDTGAASVFLLSEGMVRIDSRSSGDTVVAVQRGSAEVMAEGVSALVRAGERVFVRIGEIPGEPMVFNTLARDSFSRWSVQRDDLLALEIAGNEQPADLPDSVRPYASELSSYGTWINTPSFGWVWRPVGVASEWQPYYYGRWAYTPAGLVWVSAEPWGWAPYRYGRWEFALGTGWVWIPGYVYAGAHVAWSFSPGYFGWCPLGYYNYPVRITFAFGRYHYPWVHVQNRNVYNRYVHKSIVTEKHVINEIEREYIIVRGTPRLNPGMVNRPGTLENVHRRVAERRDIHLDQDENRRRTPFLESDRQHLVQRNTRRVRETGPLSIETRGGNNPARPVSMRPDRGAVTAPSRSQRPRSDPANASPRTTSEPRRSPAAARPQDPVRARPVSGQPEAAPRRSVPARVLPRILPGTNTPRSKPEASGVPSSTSRPSATTIPPRRGNEPARRAAPSRSSGSTSSRKATPSRSSKSTSSKKAAPARGSKSTSSKKAAPSRGSKSSGSKGSSRKSSSSKGRSGGKKDSEKKKD